MIVRARVTVKLDGTMLPRFPLVRRLDDTFLHRAPSTMAPIGEPPAPLIGTGVNARRARVVRTHGALNLQFGATAAGSVFQIRDGAIIIFDENSTDQLIVTNDQTQSIPVDAYYAE